MKYIIGIDCGASSSEAVIIPKFNTGNSLINLHADFKVTRKKFPPVNFNVHGFDESAKRLLGIISGISKNAGLKNVESVAAGVSGARFEKDRRKLAAFIRKKTGINKVQILPDTEIALASAFKVNETNCGILIAGTGSILYYRGTNGKITRIGGWGRLIGDEGSGYWIARIALSCVTKNYDLRGKKTILRKLLERNFDLKEESAVKKIYHDGFDIAKAARLVFRAAEKGDKVSKNIIRDAANELAEHFQPLKSKSAKKKYTIALTGSLFSEEKLLEKELKKIIKSKYPNIKFIKPSLHPVWGAVKIAGLNC